MFDTMFDPTIDDAPYEGIPAGLDDMGPGPVLATFLASIDVTEVSGYDRVVVLRAHQRLASHFQAHMHADIASVADAFHDTEGDPFWQDSAAAAEIRAALTWTRRTADYELRFALDLRERLPHVAEALRAGLIDTPRARTIVASTEHLSVEAAQVVVERIIDQAPELTTGQLRARLARLCIDADPEEAKNR